MNGLLQDIRLALRGFVAHPIVTALAAVSLALAIGGNATAFSLI